MIKLQNLNKKYGNSVIFENVSFTFPDKGLVCVYGPSGCGKSTLLNLLAGFDSNFEGDISACGVSLSGMDSETLCAYRRNHIGFIFQNYHLISGYSALENILLAADASKTSRAESIPEAKELLQKLGLSEKAEQKIETLSGGQKQRIAIARALINHPSVILADEPTGALDRKNSAEIMELLKALSKNRLVLIITHDKKCAEYAEQIITISDGKLVCENPTAESSESAALSAEKSPKLSLWKRALKNFRLHLPRYIGIAFALSLGVLCFAQSLSFSNIMKQSIADFEAKNTAYHNGYIRAEDNTDELLALLQEDARLENVYLQYVLKDVSVTIGEQTVTVAEKYPQARATAQMSYGSMPRTGENEIAISPAMAAKFDKDLQNLIGKPAEITCNGKTYSFLVSGIFNAVYDDFFISSDIEQQLFEGFTDKPYSVSYDVAQFEDIVSVSESLKEQGINSENAASEVAAFLDTFQTLKRLFLTVSVLILAVAIFISAILLVKQQNTRYREVGLLAALGYTKGSIRKILFYESLWLSALSVLCSGLLTALAVIISTAARLSLMFSVWQILITLCFTAVLILGISLISSVRLVRTEPADALRK